MSSRGLPPEHADVHSVSSRSTEQSRAERFRIEAPVVYRTIGEDEWSTGVAINVSRSGILFGGERVLLIGAAIELVVSLRSSSSKIVCNGRIVRYHPVTRASAAPPAMAAAVEYNEILHSH